MPALADKTTIKDPFLDKRTKLLPCQREMIHFWYGRGTSINGIAKIFHVNKRLVQFELFPDRLKKNLEDRRQRGGSKAYYNREKHCAATREHRHRKQKLLIDKNFGQ